MKKSFVVLIIAFAVSCGSHDTNYEEILEERILFLTKNQEQNTIIEKSVKHAPSLNFNLRNPAFIVIHHTEQESCDHTIKKFSNPSSMVSAHYLICKDGEIIQTAEDYTRAWHSGVGEWRNITDMNSVSLGIELENMGYEPFPEVQIESLIILLKHLQKKYKISPANIIGHGDIAPGRKEDPHCLFPWHKLANEGLAVMSNENLNESWKVPENFDPLMALRVVGYNVSDPEETITAFRRRFIGCESSSDSILSPQEVQLLYQLVTTQ